MNIQYTTPVKRQVQLSAAEAFAMKNLTKPQAAEFLKLSRRTMPDHEVSAIVELVQAQPKKSTKVTQLRKAS